MLKENVLTSNGQLEKSLIGFGFLKQAQIPDEIYHYIKRFVIPAGHLLSLVNAVGAGEYWGANNRGDYFTEEGLKHEGRDYGYLTFEYFGAPYYAHKVYPGGELGKVVKSFWIDKLKRVFVLNLINEAKYRQIVGDPYDSNVCVSMGCLVPFEICSICGKVIRKLPERCEHLAYMMNHILDDGRKVYAINTRPKFRDITYTYMPADETATVLLKVANKTENMIGNNTDKIVAEITSRWEPLESIFNRNIMRTANILSNFGVIFSPHEFNIIKSAREFSLSKLFAPPDIDTKFFLKPELVKLAEKRSIFKPYLKKQAEQDYSSKSFKFAPITNEYISYRTKLLYHNWADSISLIKNASYFDISGIPQLLLERAFGIDLSPIRECGIKFSSDDAAIAKLLHL